ncbi:hypothetical protein [Actinomycetospora atypica]|uniref:Ankyrin repeat domain-containing protein n=1 Tax=Actinomycetospora atypica TaxID=1290095 RepID=A0ABV9YGH3_9PSEU
MPDDDLDEFRWDSILDRGDLNAELFATRDQLADAARAGRWTEVLAILDEDHPFSEMITVNSIRVGGTSGFAPLHQAAWHGADLDVVSALLERGAWRTLRTSAGETAESIARRKGHDRVADGVAWPSPHLGDTRLADMETYLAALITVRARQLDKSHRMPELGPLEEYPEAKFWCPISGMYGGFSYHWLDPGGRSVLEVSNWSRVVGGSGQRHHISENGVTLVEVGFA